MFDHSIQEKTHQWEWHQFEIHLITKLLIQNVKSIREFEYYNLSKDYWDFKAVSKFDQIL